MTKKEINEQLDAIVAVAQPALKAFGDLKAKRAFTKAVNALRPAAPAPKEK